MLALALWADDDSPPPRLPLTKVDGDEAWRGGGGGASEVAAVSSTK